MLQSQKPQLKVVSILTILEENLLIEKQRLWRKGEPTTLNLILKSAEGRSLQLTVNVAYIRRSDREPHIWQLRLHDSGIHFGSEYLHGYYNTRSCSGHLRLGQL
ncbi:MAG: hypothetical protein AAB719_01385 [Patescibacteria group bacterium]